MGQFPACKQHKLTCRGSIIERRPCLLKSPCNLTTELREFTTNCGKNRIKRKNLSINLS